MSPLDALAVGGGRGRAACARLSELVEELTIALRRAVPFLARRRIDISAEPPRCITFAELAADPTTAHASAFAVRVPGSDAGLRGLVLLDGSATARILDGVLGGGGLSAPEPAPLTPAQSALVTRVTVGMVRAFGQVLSARLGIETEPIASKETNAGLAVAVALNIDGGGRVLVVVPLGAVRADEAGSTERVDPSIAAALADVELDVVAELGKVCLSLDALSRLKVGDVVRLTLSLDERARVCAGGALLFHGRPTASGDLVAVAIEARRAPRR